MQVKCRSSVSLSTNGKSAAGSRKGRRHDIVKPSMYKTSICTFYTSPGGCPFGEHCAFAHGEEELRKQPEELVEVNFNEKIGSPHHKTSETELARNNSSTANFAKTEEQQQQQQQYEEQEEQEQQVVVEKNLTESKKQSSLHENFVQKQNSVTQVHSSTIATSTQSSSPSPSLLLNLNSPMCMVSEYKMPVGLAQSPISNINKKHPINSSAAVTTLTHSTSSPHSTRISNGTEHCAINSSLNTNHSVDPTPSDNKHFISYHNNMHHQQQQHQHHHHQHNYSQQHQQQEEYCTVPAVSLSAPNNSSPTNVLVQNSYMKSYNNIHANSNYATNMFSKAPEMFSCSINTIGQTAAPVTLATTHVSDYNKYFIYPTQSINEPVHVTHTPWQGPPSSTHFSASHASSVPIPDVAQPANSTVASATTVTTAHPTSIDPFVEAAVTNNIVCYQNNQHNNNQHEVSKNSNNNNEILSPTSISVLQPFGFPQPSFCPMMPITNTSSSSSMTLLPLTATASAPQVNSSIPVHTLPLTSSTPLPLSQLNMHALGIHASSSSSSPAPPLPPPLPTQLHQQHHLPLPAAVISVTNPAVAASVTAVPKFITDTTVYQIPLNLHTWHSETAGMWPSTAAAYYYLASQQQQQQQQQEQLHQQQQINQSFNVHENRQQLTCLDKHIPFGEANTFDKRDSERTEEKAAIMDKNANHITSEPECLSSSELQLTNIPLFTSVMDESDNDVAMNELGSEWATLIEKWANSINDDEDEDKDENDFNNDNIKSEIDTNEEGVNEQNGKEQILDNNGGNINIKQEQENNDDNINSLQNERSSTIFTEEFASLHVREIDKMQKHEHDETNNNLETSEGNRETSKSNGGKKSENDEYHNKHAIKTPKRSVTQSLRETISSYPQPTLDEQLLLPKHVAIRATTTTEVAVNDLTISTNSNSINDKKSTTTPSTKQTHKTIFALEDAPMNAHNAFVANNEMLSAKADLLQPLPSKLTSKHDGKRGIMSNYFKSSCAAEAVSNAVLLYCTKREVVVTTNQTHAHDEPFDKNSVIDSNNNIDKNRHNNTVKETLFDKENEHVVSEMKETNTNANTKQHEESFVKSYVHISGIDKPVLCRLSKSNNEQQQQEVTTQQADYIAAKAPTCVATSTATSDLTESYTKKSSCTLSNNNTEDTGIALENYIDYII